MRTIKETGAIVAAGFAVAAAAIGIGIGIGAGVSAVAHADGCGQTGWGGMCDFNYAADGSHEHCDNAQSIPFVGTVRNCYWVNTRP